ncbi:hypothetical protein FRB99_002760 [Tulasnella sp. 403]|nr:hypothetical protein FRB99_002760 [Tulasnella sp. 403]
MSSSNVPSLPQPTVTDSTPAPQSIFSSSTESGPKRTPPRSAATPKPPVPPLTLSDLVMKPRLAPSPFTPGSDENADCLIQSRDKVIFGARSSALISSARGFYDTLRSCTLSFPEGEPPLNNQKKLRHFTCDEPADVLHAILQTFHPGSCPAFKSIDIAWACSLAFDKYSLSQLHWRIEEHLSLEGIVPPNKAFKACILAWRFGQFPLAVDISRYAHGGDIDTRYKILESMPTALRLYPAFVKMDAQRDRVMDLVQAKLPIDIVCASCRNENNHLRYRAFVKHVLDRPDPTIDIFLNTQQWFDAGFTKDCKTGGCQASVKGYAFSLPQRKAINGVIQTIPNELDM